MTFLASCQNLTKSFGARELFCDISLSFEVGDRIGLIGANGSGKSTLLRILVGEEQADSGEIVLSKGCRLAMLPQQDQLPPHETLREVVCAPLQAKGVEAGEAMVRAQMALSRAGFVDLEQRVQVLSGGERKRLALARVLAQSPDLLLLDEPTNHLDIESILWLQNVLRQAQFAYVLVTHDRTVLEQSTTSTIELGRRHPNGLLRVAGPYSSFIERRAELLAQQEQLDEALSNKLRREVEWLRRGVKARTTKARARVDAVADLQSQVADVRQRTGHDRSVRIDFEATGRRSKNLMKVEGLGYAFGAQALFRDLSFTLSPGTRVGLVGRNGCGKSTLLGVLSGQLEPSSGTVWRAPDLRVCVFEQLRAGLDTSLSLRRALAPDADAVVYRDAVVHVAGWAARFLFRPDQLDQPVASLSGGEQARILIARMMLQPADVLLLDEPTNDLDIASLEVLEGSLVDFPGAVVLVSHDRYLLERVCTTVLGLDGRGGAHFGADIAQWLRQLEAGAGRTGASTTSPSSPDRKEARKRSPHLHKLGFKEQRELEQLEQSIPVLEERLRAFHADLEDPELCADPFRLGALVVKMEQTERELNGCYSRWEELETKRAACDLS